MANVTALHLLPKSYFSVVPPFRCNFIDHDFCPRYPGPDKKQLCGKKLTIPVQVKVRSNPPRVILHLPPVVSVSLYKKTYDKALNVMYILMFILPFTQHTPVFL